jgi:hypothetical protein
MTGRAKVFVVLRLERESFWSAVFGVLRLERESFRSAVFGSGVGVRCQTVWRLVGHHTLITLRISLP